MISEKLPCKRCILLVRCKIKVINASNDEFLSCFSSKVILHCSLIELYVEENNFKLPYIDIELKKVFGENYQLSMSTKIFEKNKLKGIPEDAL